MELCKIPIHYIAFQRKTDLEESFKQNGFTHINQFQAVNGKQKDMNELYENGMLSTHSLHTIQNKRCSGVDLHSKGAVGCYLSHLELWKHAIKHSLPWIMIAEDDFRMKKVDAHVMNQVQNDINTLHSQSPQSLFLMDYHTNNLKRKAIPDESTAFDSIESFYGSGCYIVSLEACKILVKRAFPMSTAVDCYASILQQNKYIHIYGLKKRWSAFIMDTLNSSIQDVCVKCILPHHYIYYILALVVVGVISYKAVKCHYKKAACKPCKVLKN